MSMSTLVGASGLVWSLLPLPTVGVCLDTVTSEKTALMWLVSPCPVENSPFIR